MDRLLSCLSRGFMAAGAVSLLVVVVLATLNVAFRLLHVPYAGAYEFISFFGALITAGALGHTQRRKDHIVVDILSEKFPAPLKRFLDILNYGVTCVLFGIISRQIWRWGDTIRTSGEVSETLKVSFHPFIYGVSAGFALLTLVLFVDFMRALLHSEEVAQAKEDTSNKD